MRIPYIVPALLLFSVAFIAYLAVSSPEPDSINSNCKLNGSIERWRAQVQGQGYWISQINHLNGQVAHYERYPRQVVEERNALRLAEARTKAIMVNVNLITEASLEKAYSKLPFGDALEEANRLRKNAGLLVAEAERIELEAMQDTSAIEAPRWAEALRECVTKIKYREGL